MLKLFVYREGYLFKDADDNEITEAITTVLKGKQYYFDSAKRLEKLITKIDNYKLEMAKQVGLSADESLVLKYIVEGKNSDEILSAMNINEDKYALIFNNVLMKLNAKNVADLVRISIQKNIA